MRQLKRVSESMLQPAVATAAWSIPWMMRETDEASELPRTHTRSVKGRDDELNGVETVTAAAEFLGPGKATLSKRLQ